MTITWRSLLRISTTDLCTALKERWNAPRIYRVSKQELLSSPKLTEQRTQPFCQPFGNRRLLHCKPSSSGSESTGEVPAWEACGKVVKQERQDFYEFVVCPIRLHSILHFLFSFCRHNFNRGQGKRLLMADGKSVILNCCNGDIMG
jgi:hypothetical protein